MSPSFRVVPGDLGSSVIVHVPHSSRVIPDDVRAGIVLDDAALERELDALTDAYTDVIAERAASSAGVRPWMFVNSLSRLVVDPERFPDDREEMLSVGMGAVYSMTSGGEVLRNLPVDEISGLVDRYFAPYAGAFASLVDARLAVVGEVSIIDLHSYPLVPNPYELHAGGPRPEICLGTDRFHTPPALRDRARLAFGSFDVHDDSPFSGCYVPLKHYGTSKSVHALMIELRRDLYMDEDSALVESGAELIVTATAEMIDAIEEREDS